MAFSPAQIAEWSARGFEVNADGCLTKYTGTDPHVEIPEGVTEIGSSAFFNDELHEGSNENATISFFALKNRFKQSTKIA